CWSDSRSPGTSRSTATSQGPPSCEQPRSRATSQAGARRPRHLKEEVMRVSRLMVIVLVLAVVLASAPVPAQGPAQGKVSLRLNWYLGGLHTPFYYGKERGLYTAEGIDLTINEGRGSANTVQVIAAGSDTFGLADSSSIILTASKGADVKSVMSLLNSTGFSVISLASTGIRTPKDLEGKKLALSPGDPMWQLFQAIASVNKLDTSKISMVQVDPAAKVVAVLEKRADA